MTCTEPRLTSSAIVSINYNTPERPSASWSWPAILCTQKHNHFDLETGIMDAANVSDGTVYRDSHPLVSLVSASFWVISEFQTMYTVISFIRYSVWALSWAKSLIGFATITVPRLIYFVLSYSLTLTVWMFRDRQPDCLMRYVCSSTFGPSPLYLLHQPLDWTTGYASDILIHIPSWRSHPWSNPMPMNFIQMLTVPIPHRRSTIIWTTFCKRSEFLAFLKSRWMIFWPYTSKPDF